MDVTQITQLGIKHPNGGVALHDGGWSKSELERFVLEHGKPGTKVVERTVVTIVGEWS